MTPQTTPDHPSHAVTALQLTNFRNYAYAGLQPGTQSVVLTGHNGAGKTNILEAVSLLAPGRGFRKAKISQIDREGEGAFGGSCWAVAAELYSAGQHLRVGTGRDPESEGDKRVVKIEGKRARSQNQLAEFFSVVWLVPQMDQLFQDSEGTRRRFIDRLVYSFEPQHASRVSAYEHAMRERNRLLQSYQPDAAWLNALEQKMAENGVLIGYNRNILVDRLNKAIMMSDTSFPKADIALEGAIEQALADGVSATDVEAEFAEILAQQRRADAAASRALKGVHRSELRVRHVAKDMQAANCSTGEQKAMLLSIMLAHARARAQWHGAAPVILLDEVVAHLDQQRRGELFDEIEAMGAQTWMTGTDAADFSGMQGRASFWKVEQGQISPGE